jgi:hypothetical protein
MQWRPVASSQMPDARKPNFVTGSSGLRDLACSSDLHATACDSHKRDNPLKEWVYFLDRFDPRVNHD